MTHAHFSKYPISDLSHPKVARRRTMGRLDSFTPTCIEKGCYYEYLVPYRYWKRLWGLIMHFSIRDAPPLPSDKLRVKLALEKVNECVVSTSA